MFCINCGTENPDEAVFCCECGKKMSEFKVEKAPKMKNNDFTDIKNVKKCPHCDDEIKSGSVKCKYCGRELIAGLNTSQSSNLEFSYGLPILHLILFDILTLGIYGAIYWFYRNWKHLKAHKNLDISPGLRTVGLFVPIVGIIMIYEQFRDIKNFTEETGIKTYLSPGLLNLGFIVLSFLTARLPGIWWIITWALVLLIPIYVQNYLNKYWFQEQAGIPLKKGFSNTEIILMIISAVFIGFIILGIYLG